MHTDEYEISIGREIALCRKAIERLKNALCDKEKKYRLTTEVFLSTSEKDRPTEQNRDFRRWREDHEELQSWQQMLEEYEKALQIAKTI